MPALVVVRCGPGASVQDLGRPGHLHEGLPTGGALVPELLRAAQEALGNDSHEAAIELFLHGATFAATAPLTVSLDGDVRTLAAGEELVVPAGAEAVRYLALPGGVDVPVQLGSRATFAAARLGGLHGRFLAKDDRLHARARVPNRSTPTIAPPDSDAPFEVLPGPDAFSEEALNALFSSGFRISRALDRVGTRLEGPKVPTPADRPFSAPMVRGALQVAHDGTVIVMGPDHPATGGYPVIGCLLFRELGRLARRRPGSSVFFRRARTS